MDHFNEEEEIIRSHSEEAIVAFLRFFLILILILVGLVVTMCSCGVKKVDNSCDAYWSGNPNHKLGE